MADRSKNNELRADHLRLTSRQLTQLTKERNKLIQHLARAGFSLREIGEMASLSHTQIANIVEADR